MRISFRSSSTLPRPRAFLLPPNLSLGRRPLVPAVYSPVREASSVSEANKTQVPPTIRKDFKTIPIEKEIQRAQDEASRLEFESTKAALRAALFQKNNPMKALDLARNFSMKRYKTLGKAVLEYWTFHLYLLIVEYFAQKSDTSRLPLVTDSMRRIGVPIIANTYGDFINVVGKKGHLTSAVALLRQLRKDGFQPTAYVYNVLIDAFVCAGDAKSAMKYFEEMPHNGVKPDTVTYNLILSLLAKGKDIDSSIALGIFEEMTKSEVPLNEASIIFLLNIFSRAADEPGVLNVLKTAEEKGIPVRLKCYPAVISLYSKKDDFAKAMEWLHLCRDRGLKPDALCYGPILDLCRRSDRSSNAMELFDEMKADGVTLDSFCLSIFLHFQFLKGSPEVAIRAYEEAYERKSKLDIAVYSTLLHGLASIPTSRSKCHEYFKRMVYSKLKQNGQVLTTMLKVCLADENPSKASEYFENAKKFIVPTADHFNLLMTVYSNKGLDKDVALLFEELCATDGKPDLSSFRAGLSAYASLGRAEDLLKTYESMSSREVVPDPPLTAMVIQALEKAGLKDEASRLGQGSINPK